MGAWMKVNSEAIYDTKASPFGLLTWGRCTKKENGKNTIFYFSVFDWPKDGKLSIPGLNTEIISVSLLANGTILKTEATDGGLAIKLPEKSPDPIATVIKCEVKGMMDTRVTKPKE